MEIEEVVSEFEENNNDELYNEEIIEVNKKLDELTESLIEKDNVEINSLNEVNKEQERLLKEFEESQGVLIESIINDEYQETVLVSLNELIELQKINNNNILEIYSGSLVFIGFFVGILLTKFFIGGFDS